MNNEYVYKETSTPRNSGYPVWPDVPCDRPWLTTYERYHISASIDRPRQNSSLLEMFEKSFTDYRNRIAYISMGVTLSYGELDQYSRRLATYLQQLGLKQGDKVGMMMPNILLYPIIALGIIRAGMILVNINHLYSSRDLKYQLSDSGAKALFIIENHAKTYQDIADQVNIDHLILGNMGDMLGMMKGLWVNTTERIIKKEVSSYYLPNSIAFTQALYSVKVDSYQRPDLHLNDVALIQYTGGTTGISKGAMLTHGNLMVNLLQFNSIMAAAFENTNTDKDVILCALPLSHIFSFTLCGLYTLYVGAAGLLITDPTNISELVKSLNKHKPAYIPAVNTLFESIVNHEEFVNIDFSNLKLALSGGTFVVPSVAKAWHEVTGLPIIEGYGLTETAPLATFNPVTSSEFTGKIGIPTPDTDIILISDVDDNGLGIEVPLGERGEICIKGPQVMLGYYHQEIGEEGTSISITDTDNVFTADGYLKTGDIAIMDEKGYLKIVDRKKDMIIVSGFNVYPNEVEIVLLSHPNVVDCAVIGIPSGKRGEEPKAYVVAQGDIDEETLLTFGRRHLTSYKRPRHIQFVKELPRTSNDKLLRRELRKMEGLE